MPKSNPNIEPNQDSRSPDSSAPRNVSDADIKRADEQARRRSEHTARLSAKVSAEDAAKQAATNAELQKILSDPKSMHGYSKKVMSGKELADFEKAFDEERARNAQVSEAVGMNEVDRAKYEEGVGAALTGAFKDFDKKESLDRVKTSHEKWRRDVLVPAKADKLARELRGDEDEVEEKVADSSRSEMADEWNRMGKSSEDIAIERKAADEQIKPKYDRQHEDKAIARTKDAFEKRSAEKAREERSVPDMLLEKAMNNGELINVFVPDFGFVSGMALPVHKMDGQVDKGNVDILMQDPHTNEEKWARYSRDEVIDWQRAAHTEPSEGLVGRVDSMSVSDLKGRADRIRETLDRSPEDSMYSGQDLRDKNIQLMADLKLVENTIFSKANAQKYAPDKKERVAAPPQASDQELEKGWDDAGLKSEQQVLDEMRNRDIARSKSKKQEVNQPPLVTEDALAKGRDEAEEPYKEGLDRRQKNNERLKREEFESRKAAEAAKENAETQEVVENEPTGLKQLEVSGWLKTADVAALTEQARQIRERLADWDDESNEDSILSAEQRDWVKAKNVLNLAYIDGRLSALDESTPSDEGVGEPVPVDVPVRPTEVPAAEGGGGPPGGGEGPPVPPETPAVPEAPASPEMETAEGDLEHFNDAISALQDAIDKVLQDAAEYKPTAAESKAMLKWKPGEPWPLDDGVTAENFADRVPAGVAALIDSSLIEDGDTPHSLLAKQLERTQRDMRAKRLEIRAMQGAAEKVADRAAIADALAERMRSEAVESSDQMSEAEVIEEVSETPDAPSSSQARVLEREPEEDDEEVEEEPGDFEFGGQQWNVGQSIEYTDTKGVKRAYKVKEYRDGLRKKIVIEPANGVGRNIALYPSSLTRVKKI